MLLLAKLNYSSVVDLQNRLWKVENGTYGDGGVCNWQGGDLHAAREAVANLANAPTVEEEHQTHGQSEPERYGRLDSHLHRYYQFHSPMNSRIITKHYLSQVSRALQPSTKSVEFQQQRPCPASSDSHDTPTKASDSCPGEYLTILSQSLFLLHGNSFRQFIATMQLLLLARN